MPATESGLEAAQSDSVLGELLSALVQKLRLAAVQGEGKEGMEGGGHFGGHCTRETRKWVQRVRTVILMIHNRTLWYLRGVVGVGPSLLGACRSKTCTSRLLK